MIARSLKVSPEAEGARAEERAGEADTGSGGEHGAVPAGIPGMLGYGTGRTGCLHETRERASGERGAHLATMRGGWTNRAGLMVRRSAVDSWPQRLVARQRPAELVADQVIDPPQG